MPRTPIGLIWLGGILLAALLYAVGPDQLGTRLWEIQADISDAAWGFARALTFGAMDVLHAVALALYVVFVVLCLLAGRQGLRPGRTLVVVSVVFLLLAYGSSDVDGGGTHWLGAALLAGLAAAIMTRRLTRAGALWTR